jgi:hypothetical protein
MEKVNMNSLKALFLSINKEAKSDLGLLVYNYFKDNPNPEDEDFHKFIEAKGINVHEAEDEAYKLATLYVQFMEGGNSNENKSLIKIDDSQLKKGIEIEKEHTSNVDIATKIARDHLSEYNYYTALDEMESNLKGK